MRERVRHGLAVTLLTLATAASASAQVCLGKPGFKAAPTNIGLGAEFTDGAKGIAGSFGFGSEKTFGIAGVGYASYRDFDASATGFSAAVGTSIQSSEGSAMRICPIGQVSYGYGPNEETALGKLKISSLGLLAGASFGGTVDVNPGFSVIPHAIGGVLHRRSTASLNGTSASANDTGGLIGGGVSLLFGATFTLEPSVSIPVGFDTNDPTFSIGVTVGFKRSK